MTREQIIHRALVTLRVVLPVIAGLAALMLLAALPDVWYRDMDSVLRVRPGTIPHNMYEYVRGLFTGDSWTYHETWYQRDFMTTMYPRIVRSLRYLLTSALLATTLGLLAGAWLTGTRRDRFRDLLTFAGAVPDFMLALLLQIAVVAVFKSTGFRIARVASITNDQAAVLLPLISLTLIPAVYLMRTLSARAYVIASEDFVLTAKASGMGRLRIWVQQILPNLTAFLRADLAKVCGMMLANFFIVEYLYNLKGVTALVFAFAISYSYQYALVMNSFLLMIFIYAVVYLVLRLYIRLLDAVTARL